jgi:hypothetical protein
MQKLDLFEYFQTTFSEQLASFLKTPTSQQTCESGKFFIKMLQVQLRLELIEIY